MPPRSEFDQLVSTHVDPFVDSHMGELLLLIPQLRSPNGRGGPDPDRPEQEVIGVFFYPSVQFGLELGVRSSYREANDLRTLQTGRDAEASIQRSKFASVAMEPRQGDYLRALARPELPDFEVSSTMRDGHTRLVLALIHLGGQA